MGCNRGRASPDTNTQRRLFAASGGYCQNPSCNRALFVNAATEIVSVAEMAHIFAAEDDGPRANLALTAEQRGDFSNLILLCANCHTVVDKASVAFSDDTILKWKVEHEARIATVFGSVAYSSRAEAGKALIALRARTGSIHQRIGPENEYKWNPEADEAVEWQFHIRQTIIPANRSILALFERNQNLISESEQAIVELFRQHVEGLEQRHIFGLPLPSAPKYPAGMSQMFQGEESE